MVPPNTTASVTLPGSDAASLEVGSGTHRWSYAYEAPGAHRPRLSLDSTLAELVDDAAALAAALQRVPSLTRFEAGLQGSGDMPLSRVVSLLPNPAESRVALEAALAALGR